MNNLIVVDQTPLIEQAIMDLERWHQKIEDLEIELQRFQDRDLKLYSEWSQLTSQKYQNELNETYEKYKALAEFHDWVIYTADDQNISLAEAYYLMALEQEQYKNGNEHQRARIDEVREARRYSINGGGESERAGTGDYESTHEDEASSEEDGVNDARIREARKTYSNEIRYFESLTEKQIKKIMKDPEEAVRLIVECVTVCLEAYRFDLIHKIWNCAGKKIKKMFNTGFKAEFGMTLDTLLDRVDYSAREKAGVDEDEDFDFARHYEDPFTSRDKFTKNKSSKKSTTGENSELAKIYYRRLMLKIHPDKLPAGFIDTKKKWLDRLWKKINVAYTEQNVSALQSLHLQVLISLRLYSEITYSELKQGAAILGKEYSKVRESQAQSLSHPAWGFSELTSYKKLERNLAQPYKDAQKNMSNEMIKLEKLHAALKHSADEALQNGGFEPNYSISRRRRTRRYR